MSQAYLFPEQVPLLVTPRLELRGFRDSDAQDLFAMFSDPETMRYGSHPPWAHISQAHAFMERDRLHFTEQSHLRWGITLRGTGRVMGNCGVHFMDSQNRRAEIGYGLARHAWGQGYMQEALGAMLAHVFETVGLRRLEADIDPRNTASIRALEKQGFEREGYLKERWIVGDEICDTVLMGLLRANWKPAGKSEA